MAARLLGDEVSNVLRCRGDDPPSAGHHLAYKGSPVPDVFLHSHGVVQDWRNRTDRTWHNQSQHTALYLGTYITCSHGEGGKNNKKKFP